MKIYLKIITVSIISTLILFEIYLRFNKEILYNLKNLLPDTNVTKNIKNEIVNKSESKRKIYSINDIDYSLYKESFHKKIHSKDKKFGAIEQNFYNEGFCNHKNNSKKKNILAVGDSFTYCLAVKPENSWVNNISQYKELDYLNFGVVGKGPFDYINFLSEKINNNTSLVIFAFYEGNDFRDMISQNKTTASSISNNINNSNQIKGKFKLPKKIFGNLYSFNFFWAIIKKIILNDQLINFKYLVKGKNYEINFNLSNSDVDEVMHANVLLSDKSKYIDFFEKSLSLYFHKALKVSSNYKSEIVFIYIPSAYSAFGYNSTEFEDKNVKEKVFEYSKILSSSFDKICRNEKLNCINYIRIFNRYNSESNVPSHFPNNLHLTIEGHKLVAKEIRKFVCNEKKNYLNFNDC